jgi:hypothetical protein
MNQHSENLFQQGLRLFHEGNTTVPDQAEENERKDVLPVNLIGDG